MAVRADDAGLHKKLVWLTFFRVVSVTVLLGGAAAVAWDDERGLAAANRNALAALFPERFR